jgi:hypothetical protein
MEQNPVKDLYYITVKDLTKEGMMQWKKTPAWEKQNVTFCVLCQAKVKAVKVSGFGIGHEGWGNFGGGNADDA